MFKNSGNAKSNVYNEILTKVGYRKHKDDKDRIGIVHGEKYIPELLFVKNIFDKKILC